MRRTCFPGGKKNKQHICMCGIRVVYKWHHARIQHHQYSIGQPPRLDSQKVFAFCLAVRWPSVFFVFCLSAVWWCFFFLPCRPEAARWQKQHNTSCRNIMCSSCCNSLCWAFFLPCLAPPIPQAMITCCASVRRQRSY